MSDRTRIVVKREFTEAVRTKTFIIGTLLAPVFMVVIFALPILLMEGGGGGERSIAVVDATGERIGERVVAGLSAVGSGAGGGATTAAAGAGDGGENGDDRRVFRAELVPLRAGMDADSVRAELAARVDADELDGYLWLPTELLADVDALYEGENATNLADVTELRAVLQSVVREHRMREAGMEPAQVAAAMRPVGMDARKGGDDSATGSVGAAIFVATTLGFVIYMAMFLYGQQVMRGVLEEKRDRIVEILASSVRIHQLMMGKVLGIGAMGLLQLAIWIGLAALALTQGDAIAARFGAEMPPLPGVPAGIGIAFVFYFLGGYFLYASLFAIVGASVTSDQEAQQLIFPVMIPILAGFFIMMPGVQNPETTSMVVGSIVPFTSPIVMPARMALVDVPALELIGSITLLAATAVGCVWVAAKIYRIGMLATGTRPSLRELVRWVRAA
ncbi:MAG: ABC transporter permease [Gemmatimonadota bacterium]